MALGAVTQVADTQAVAQAVLTERIMLADKSPLCAEPAPDGVLAAESCG